ncbi:Methyl-CpG-binding domain-containing protein [Quillaja saponaria]|uniref:Methyl-CpG-binding domain-containing protein n=1 Tax=Quillaja saponaria TaxID=32244 RepID=A0AAD7VM05_QUISA|nr:Methyl-CpG-binding domain-containing protein [Quillaja saponaria]
MRRPGEEEEEKPSNGGREFQNATSSSFPFTLPAGWYVEERPRVSDPGHIDRYYHEPGTGRRFRSFISVQRYLTEDRTAIPIAGTLKSADEYNMQIVTRYSGSTSSVKLPDGWVVEERPRKSNTYQKKDKYYIEPETGVRFRSLKAVERYLTEVDKYLTEANACTGTSKPSTQSGLVKENVSGKEQSPQVKKCVSSEPSKKSGSGKKINSGEDSKTSLLNFSSPPAKIEWVLSGPGGNMWSPFMGEYTVPDSVKQKWSETFILALQERYPCT